jgi:hypothetical protein
MAKSPKRLTHLWDGITVETWYCWQWRSWCTHVHDGHRNQIGDADYSHTHEGAEMDHAQAIMRLDRRRQDWQSTAEKIDADLAALPADRHAAYLSGYRRGQDCTQELFTRRAPRTVTESAAEIKCLPVTANCNITSPDAITRKEQR